MHKRIRPHTYTHSQLPTHVAQDQPRTQPALSSCSPFLSISRPCPFLTLIHPPTQLKDDKGSMTVARARALHTAGITSLEALALAEPEDIQRVMVAALPRNMRNAERIVGKDGAPMSKWVEGGSADGGCAAERLHFCGCTLAQHAERLASRGTAQ